MMRSLRENWEIALLLLVMLPIFILDILPDYMVPIDVSDSDLLKLILVALLVIGASHLKHDTSRIMDGLNMANRQIGEVLLLSRGKMTPVRPSENPGIWSGFTGVYLAINAPWRVESYSSDNFDTMVESHAKRYMNSQFKRAIYVFFEQGKSGQHFPDAMYNFRQFAEKMVEKEPDAAEKVQVIVAKDVDAPAFTLFVGEKDIDLDDTTKECSPYSVVYINQEPLVSKNGLPKWAIVSVDSEFNGTLKDYANRYLDNYDPMQLGEFLESEYGHEKA